MRQEPRICLNMIVRNEAAIIERCLASVAPAIDGYVICDTGSNDDTVARIRRFMDARGLEGQVHHTAFDNFGSARNRALEHCRQSKQSFEYILLADADMELRIADREFFGALTAPAYALRQHNQISYYNTRLIRRDIDARYIGMTHEYLSLGCPVTRSEALWFYDHACGSSRSEKFERDVRLLSLELELDPSNARAMFYLAQAYRDKGEYLKAIQWFRRRAIAGGWEEEAWYALFSAALSHRDLGESSEFIRTALAAHGRRPIRAEPLHALARHYRENGRFDDAMSVAEIGAAISRPGSEIFFIHDGVYDFGFTEEISIAGYYSSDPSRRLAGRAACADLATRRGVPAVVQSTARRNWVHYARSAAELFGSCAIKSIPFASEKPWRPFNPSIAIYDGHAEVILRTANYRIDERGRYIADEGVIQTRNYLLRLNDDLDVVEQRELHEGGPDVSVPGASIVGLEDCRLFEWRGRRCCSFTIRDRNPAGRCEIGLGGIFSGETVSVTRLLGYRDDVHQKNWVPLVKRGELLFVYSTDPLVVLALDKSDRPYEISRHETTLALDHLRGGSQAIPVDDGWLYLAHEVSVFDATRVYLHRFVRLREDFSIVAVSEAFYFAARQIEYAAGLARDGNRLLVTFGTQDHDAWIASLDFIAVEALLR